MSRTPTQATKLKLSIKKKNVINKKNDSVSTPLPSYVDSPPTLGDSPSPIPFLCTQDESDVVWNYYSPTSENGSPTNIDKTPRTRKRKKNFYYNDFSPLTRVPTKKKFVRPAIKNMEFLKGLKEELTALNQNLQEKNKQSTSKESDKNSNSDDTLFENSIEQTAECHARDEPIIASTPRPSNSPTDEAFEDSMNEILIRATQSIEENVLNENVGIKLCLTESFTNKLKVDSPKITNDSLDNILGNMNDSEIEFLASQVPQITSTSSCTGKKIVNKFTASSTVTSSSTNTNQKNGRSNVKINNNTSIWNDDMDSLLNNIPNISSLVNNSILNESRTKFMRHNSMPESPGRRTPQITKSNYSGKTTLQRHISMPVNGAKLVANSEEFSEAIKCTPEDIKRKHEAAKEKLLAKKLEPLAKKSPQAFYGYNNNNNSSRGQPLKTVSSNNIQTRSCSDLNKNTSKDGKKSSLQEQIERKRQEALMKLQRNRSSTIRKC